MKMMLLFLSSLFLYKTLRYRYMYILMLIIMSYLPYHCAEFLFYSQRLNPTS